MSLTPRQRVLRALEGGHADKVPFTVYERKIPQCAAERELRNRGLCIAHRIGVVKELHPNVKQTTVTSHEGGKTLVRTHYETPHGTLTSVVEPAGFTGWSHRRMWNGPDDYKALLFYIKDTVIEPDYGPAADAIGYLGDDAIVKTNFALEPLQMMISGPFIKMEDFCLEWMERRDEILKLVDAYVEVQRRKYPLVAESPCQLANYGGNVVPEITSPAMYRDYYLPHYQEAAEAMHARGKLIGCHYDANCGNLAECIAESPLDYIEAFTPAPDTDMTLGQARSAWPDKTIWMNFPSSVHLRPDAEVTRCTVELLGQVDSIDGLIMGITEDVPEHRWRDSFRAIMDGLDEVSTKE